VLRDTFVKPLLVNRSLTGVDRRNDLFVDIDVDYIVSEVGEAGGNRGTHVPASNDRDVHVKSYPRRLFERSG
jgi:hypothetical protein